MSTSLAASRLRQICLAAPSLAPWVGQLQQLFGLGAAYDDPHVAKYGLANAVLAVGHQFIELVARCRATRRCTASWPATRAVPATS